MIQREKSDLTGLVTGAIFSDCERYRYRLWRRWDLEKPKINFLMLNPSTADDVKNDPTVERCERRARSLGAGELIVTNIFAYRATYPAELLTIDDPVGEGNTGEILHAAHVADVVVCAWGLAGGIRGRGQSVLDCLRLERIKLYCLGKTQNGVPKHPLYIPYSQKLEPF